MPALAPAPGRGPGPCPAWPCPARPAPVWQRLMAAVGPPQQQVRMAHQQVWAALEVALRVPCLYIIDAIFNSYPDSSQSRFCIVLQIFLRLLGKGTGYPASRDRSAGRDVPRGAGRRGRPWVEYVSLGTTISSLKGSSVQGGRGKEMILV